MVALALLSQACAVPDSRDGAREISSPAAVALDHSALQAAAPDGRQVVQAWRRDGERLAAGFVDGQGQGLLVVSDRSGKRLAAHPMPGRILAVAWSARDDLLIAGYRLQEFSFGANLFQWLVRIDGEQRVQIELGDTTLKPATAKRLKASLPELLSVVFSPAGDELAFLRLYDPPQFPAYLRLLYRNWQVPTDRKLLDLPVQPTGIEWLLPGDVLACRSRDNDVQRIELWPVADAARRGDSAGSAELPPAEEHNRMWTLRKWRFAGLITPDEFRKTVKGMQP